MSYAEKLKDLQARMVTAGYDKDAKLLEQAVRMAEQFQGVYDFMLIVEKGMRQHTERSEAVAKGMRTALHDRMKAKYAKGRKPTSKPPLDEGWEDWK